MQLLPDEGPPAVRRDDHPEGWGERGRCPRCGSGRDAHLVYGLPTRDLVESAPPCVWFPGCVTDGPEDRDCGACGHTWVNERTGRDPVGGSAPVGRR